MPMGHTITVKKRQKQTNKQTNLAAKSAGTEHIRTVTFLMIIINIFAVISCEFMTQLKLNMTVQIRKIYSPNRKCTYNNYTRGFSHDTFKRMRKRDRLIGGKKERERERERERESSHHRC